MYWTTCPLGKHCWITQNQLFIPQIVYWLMFWHIILSNAAHFLFVLWLQWMRDVSDRTGYSMSKMFCFMLTDESRWCGVDITVLWCWPWSTECKRPECCRCGNIWADATNLYWGTSTCNRKFWVNALEADVTQCQLVEYCWCCGRISGSVQFTHFGEL